MKVARMEDGRLQTPPMQWSPGFCSERVARVCAETRYAQVHVARVRNVLSCLGGTVDTSGRLIYRKMRDLAQGSEFAQGR